MLRTKRSWPGTSTKPSRRRRRAAVGEAEVDRHAARLLLGQPVGVDAGQRPDQAGLAVVDVARGGDDHGAASLRLRSASGASCATDRSSASRQRRSSSSAPSRDAADDRHRQARAARRPALRRAPAPRSPAGARAPRSAASSTGSAPLPIWLAQSTASTTCAAERRRKRGAGAAPRARSRRPAARAGAAPAGARRAGPGRDRARSIASSAASVILSTRSARFSGFLRMRATRSARPTMMPGLRAAEQLVAAEGDEIGAVARSPRATVGSCGRPQRAEIDAACRCRDRRRTARRARGASAAQLAPRDTRAVKPRSRSCCVCTFSSSAGLRADRLARSRARWVRLVVPTSTQPAPALRHDVGHAEGAADLDQLAARDRHLAAARQRVEHQQHRGGVVVDDGRGLGAGQLAEQAARHGRRARRAGRRRGRTRGSTAQRTPRPRPPRSLLRQRRAAEIGVQHRAGQVEHRCEPRSIKRLERGRGRARGA